MRQSTVEYDEFSKQARDSLRYYRGTLESLAPILESFERDVPDIELLGERWLVEAKILRALSRDFAEFLNRAAEKVQVALDLTEPNQK